MVKEYVQIKKVRKISIKKIHPSVFSATKTIYSAHASPGTTGQRNPGTPGLADWASRALAGRNGLTNQAPAPDELLK